MSAAGRSADLDPDRPQFVSAFLLFDGAGTLLRTEVVAGWDPVGWDAIEQMDREGREIGGLLVPSHGVRDYRRPAT